MSFPRYPQYKDSGAEWLRETPKHWGMAALKYLVSMKSGGTPSKDNLDYWDGDISWASAKDLKVDYLSDTADHITQDAVDAGASLVPAGSLLVVVRGMILAKIFPVVQTKTPMAINQDLKALQPKPGIGSRYLSWLLRGAEKESMRRTDEAGHGTKALRMDIWGAMPLPVPPVDEQCVIATFLDRETAKLNELMAEQEKLIALLKEKRQAVIAHAVTKGLDPTVPMKDSGVEWLGEMPTHWQLKRVKHCVNNFDQGWSPQCESYPVASEDEWGVLKVGCVNGGIFNPEENKSLPTELDPLPELGIRKGDLLISRANTRELVGSAAVALRDYPNLLLCDKLYRLRLDGAIANTEFVAYYFSIGQARGQIELSASGASSSMLNISQATILDMTIALPADEEQKEIVAFIESEQIELKALISEAQHAIDLLKERRTALISAAVTGQIDVRGLIKDEQEQAA